MSEIKILEKNPQKLANILSCVLSQEEQEKITALIHKHAKLLMKLGINHLMFAKSIKQNQAWRQKVSRAYYACYNFSKALRLVDTGHYSQETRDHKKISDLPDSFNDRSYWQDFLTMFKGDRNIADYDHMKKAGDLECSPKEYIDKSDKFCKEVKKYFKGKGVL